MHEIEPSILAILPFLVESTHNSANNTPQDGRLTHLGGSRLLVRRKASGIAALAAERFDGAPAGKAVVDRLRTGGSLRFHRAHSQTNCPAQDDRLHRDSRALPFRRRGCRSDLSVRSRRGSNRQALRGRRGRASRNVSPTRGRGAGRADSSLLCALLSTHRGMRHEALAESVDFRLLLLCPNSKGEGRRNSRLRLLFGQSRYSLKDTLDRQRRRLRQGHGAIY